MKAFLVTLTTSGVVYNLASLVRAIESDFKDRYSQIVLYGPTSLATNTIKVGDADVTDTRYGFLVANGSSISLGNGDYPVAALGINLKPSADALTMGVTFLP